MRSWGATTNHLVGHQKKRVFLCRNGFSLTAYLFLLFLSYRVIPVQAVQTRFFSPPAIPQIAPIISTTYPNDTDQNAIDDELEAKAAVAKTRLKSAATSKDMAEADSVLTGTVEVELIFKEQITQQQIDDFLSHGGEITHIYNAVSYGWNGRIALGSVSMLPSLMSSTLVLVQEAKPLTLHLDTATRTGRVRPIWASGFAGNPSGFDGSNTITVAIVDTGIDAAHSDLSGRQVYWHDFSSDSAGSPIDIVQHGSHVAGIALGTGAASGAGTGTLYYTDEGNLTGVSSGSFYPYPLGLPAASVTYTSTAQWTGGGSTSLYQAYHTKGTSGGWTAISAAASGSSPLTEINTFTGLSSRAYSTALLSNGAMGNFVITNSVTNYPGVGDGFNKLRGIAPGCNWAAAKVFTNSGAGYTTWMSAALDDLTATRVANHIKVINMSIGIDGNPGIDTGLRSKVNTAVNNGIVVVISAGNDGKNTGSNGYREIDDPGRAAMALTVAASNDEDQLTDYTSIGFGSPSSISGRQEDYKPDVMAPGGSANYHTAILSVDSGSADGAFADQQSNDYTSMQGTSMSSPFAAGAAALVIDALEQSGVVWDFGSSQHSRYVKMLLCATASETNIDREGGSYNPTLQRASVGPSGFPAGKDQYEGYGMINPEAAVEAVTLTYTAGSSAGDTLGPGTSDRRVWARKIGLTQGESFIPLLTIPAGGDFDLYLYSTTPSAYGTPVILASSVNAGTGVNESFNYVPGTNANALLVVKKVSGSGMFTLATNVPPPAQATAPNPANATTNVTLTADLSWTAGFGATSHDVYFGTSSPGTFRGNQAGTTFDTGTMSANTTYYWRIDEKNAGGTTTGIVWSFSTNAQVPNVVGSTQIAATTAINGAGLVVGAVTQQYSDTVAAELVINQNPVGETQVNTGSSVDLVVSLGLPVIPDVTGQAQAPAEAAITAATFTVGIITTAHSDTIAAGNVISQSPAGGTAIVSGTTIDLVVSDGPRDRIISGHILEPDAVTPLAGVFVTANNGGSSDTTDPNGYYELTVAYGWSGVVDPNATGYTFDPNSLTYTNVTSDIADQNFIGSLDAFVIAGHILKDDGVTPIEDVTITPENGGGYFTNKYNAGGASITDPNGDYEVMVDYAWSGKVTPTHNAYSFAPADSNYSNVIADINDQNYAGMMLTFSISGYIKNILGVPLEGATVAASNGGGIDTTDPNGYYQVGVNYGWTGSVTAARMDYTFTPEAPYVNVTTNMTGDFLAKLDADINGDGYVDISDLLILCQNWLTAGDLSAGNLNEDTSIDMQDIAEMSEYWLESM